MDPGLIKIYKYHGAGKEIDIDSMIGYDIVMTTYATVASDVAKKSSLLRQITWFRIVLDEGMDPLADSPAPSQAEVNFL